MQQSIYNKLGLVQLGLVVFCTIIAFLVAMFFLTPMMQFGGGPPEMGGPYLVGGPYLIGGSPEMDGPYVVGGPYVMDGSSDMEGPPTIPDDVIEDLKKEIAARESVITFKETFPDYRESFKEDYGISYSIQARNSVTGNVFALNVNYHPMGPQGNTDKFRDSEDLRCNPGENIFVTKRMQQMMWRGQADLFVPDTIKSTSCLDDDWESKMRTVEKSLP